MLIFVKIRTKKELALENKMAKSFKSMSFGPERALSKGKGKSKMTVSPLHLVEKDTMDKEKALEAALGQIDGLSARDRL